MSASLSPLKLLFLGPEDSPLYKWLQEREDVSQSSDPINTENIIQFEYLISYGYRHIIKEEILKLFPQKAINLHISLLPWNRGADPNLWSYVDDTPKGVTIHELDKGLDTGPILLQKEVTLLPELTLRESYALLQSEIQTLFKDNWPSLKNGLIKSTPQTGKGTFHRSVDKRLLDLPENYLDLFPGSATGLRIQWGQPRGGSTPLLSKQNQGLSDEH